MLLGLVPCPFLAWLSGWRRESWLVGLWLWDQPVAAAGHLPVETIPSIYRYIHTHLSSYTSMEYHKFN